MVKSIKVSDEEYEKIVEARKELAKRGVQGLPIKPEEVVDLGDLTLGAIVALGALALIYLLSEKQG